MHITTTISISVVLFLVGLLSILLLTAHELSTKIKDNVKFSVILDRDADKSSIERIERYLELSPFSKSVEYISKEKAIKEFVNSLGENPEDFLGYNPLLASFEVKLKDAYVNTDSIAAIEAKLKGFKTINRIIYQRDLIDFVNENIKKVGVVLMSLTLILLLISFVLINNTIRLALHSDRFIINTMKLVGASSWFIRKPYLKRWMFSGFLSSMLAITYIALLLYYAQSEFGFEGMSLSFQVAAAVILIIVLMGILITSMSANFIIKKYIKMSTNDIYSM